MAGKYNISSQCYDNMIKNQIAIPVNNLLWGERLLYWGRWEGERCVWILTGSIFNLYLTKHVFNPSLYIWRTCLTFQVTGNNSRRKNFHGFVRREFDGVQDFFDRTIKIFLFFRNWSNSFVTDSRVAVKKSFKTFKSSFQRPKMFFLSVNSGWSSENVTKDVSLSLVISFFVRDFL